MATAEFWYNTCLHSAIGRSPFEALYGYSPRLLVLPTSDPSEFEVAGWSADRAVMDQLLQHHLHRGAHCLKKQAYQQRSERHFEVGDKVFLKLQPYVQSSLAPRSNQKLAFRFFGPYEVIQRVGSVAYKLALPTHSAIHPVFHVSQLKNAVGAAHQISPTLPSDFALKLAPEQVLQTRSVRRGDSKIQQVLIKVNKLASITCHLGRL